MCGITGYLHFNNSLTADSVLLKKMTDCIAYRGPDGEGFYLKDNLALGHRRLSIIDLSTGDQPMFSDDGKIALVFNGEIYNYIELKEELIQLGHQFKTHSDTEVLIRSYEQWGYDCQNKFNGMWAFALWDENKKELFLSRDRIGEKPLHYAAHDNTFIFGSEIKCMLQYGVPKEIRTELIEIYLTLTNIPAPDTFYKNIFKLMPGHYLVVKDGQVSEKAYWTFPQVNEADMITDKELVYETFETLLNDAVKIRMRCDVPFGAFLSGGLDSSAIVSLMAKNTTHPVKTFTIGFDNKDFDESALAKEVSVKFKTEHFRGTVLPEDLMAAVEKVFLHTDEPFGDSSAIPTDFVSAYAAKKVKMVLTGDGGDEVLSGYTAYKALKVSSQLNKWLPRPARSLITFSITHLAKIFKGELRFKLNKINRVLKASQKSFQHSMAEQIAFTDILLIKKLCAGIDNVIPVENYFERLLKPCKFKDDFYKLMYVHYHHHLPNDFLVKVDRMSMANSIEARLPFLDYRLVEFMAGVHKDIKMQGFETKSILRKTIGKNLPASILAAPKKGFAVPLRDWFKNGDFKDLFQNRFQHTKNLLDRDVLLKIVSENNSGGKDNGNFIWTLLQLEQGLVADCLTR